MTEQNVTEARRAGRF